MPHVVLELGTVIVVALLWFAAWCDVATRTIPNRICIALAIIGLIIRVNSGLPAVALSVGTVVVLFVALALLHARKVIGGGDVKLLAALALGLPLLGTYHLIVATVFAGGLLALLHLTLRLLPSPAPCPAGAAIPRRVLAAERWRIRRHGSLPYGVAIACGGSIIFLSGVGG